MFRIFRINYLLYYLLYLLNYLYYTAKYPQNGWCIILVTVTLSSMVLWLGNNAREVFKQVTQTAWNMIFLVFH